MGAGIKSNQDQDQEKRLCGLTGDVREEIGECQPRRRCANRSA